LHAHFELMWFYFALSSALLSATAAIFEKRVLFETGALSFSFLLALFNAVFSLPFLFFIDLSAVTLTTYLYVALKSLLGSISFLLVMSGIKRLELSSALPLLVLTPGLVAVFAWIFLGDILTGAEIFGMILLLAGTYMLQTGGFSNLLKPLRITFIKKGYWYIVGALAVFTLTSLLDKWLLSSYKLSPEVFLPLQHFFMALFFTVFAATGKVLRQALHSDLKKVWRLVLLVAVVTILYRYAHIWAVKTGAVALALSVKRTSVFFAALIGGYIFKEERLMFKAIAISIMVFGAIMVILD